MMIKNVLVTALATSLTILTFGQSSLGKWVTIDDKTSKKKSIVEPYKEGELLYGKIEYLYPREGLEPNATCKKCTDDRKDKPLVGLQIVRGLKWTGGAWEDGTIVDPENGKIYTVKMWVTKDKPNVLNVRGYIGPFYRTQTWTRVTD